MSFFFRLQWLWSYLESKGRRLRYGVTSTTNPNRTSPHLPARGTKIPHVFPVSHFHSTRASPLQSEVSFVQLRLIPHPVQPVLGANRKLMLSTSPSTNTPEILLLYHELEHAVLFLQREVQTLVCKDHTCVTSSGISLKRWQHLPLCTWKITYLLTCWPPTWKAVLYCSPPLYWNKCEQGDVGGKIKNKKIIMPGSYYCIQSETKHPRVHFSPSVLYFSFLFKTYQRDSILKSAFCPGPVPAPESNFYHWHILKREESFIRLLTLENFWSLQKDNSHSCYMADWPRPQLHFRCPKSQWWFAFIARSIQLPLLMLHSIILLPGPLPLYCTAGWGTRTDQIFFPFKQMVCCSSLLWEASQFILV